MTAASDTRQLGSLMAGFWSWPAGPRKPKFSPRRRSTIPAQRSWSAAGSIDGARGQHNAVRLSDGRVLVAGGEDGNTALASAEVFDPDLASWTAVADMSDAALVLRRRPARRRDGADRRGRVRRIASVERRAVRSGYSTWTATTDLTEPRSQLVAVRLADGRVLAAGGGQTGNPTAEIYDPQSGEWTLTGNMTAWRASPMSRLCCPTARFFWPAASPRTPQRLKCSIPRSGGPVASAPPWFSQCGPGCQGPIQAGTFTVEHIPARTADDRRRRLVQHGRLFAATPDRSIRRRSPLLEKSGRVVANRRVAARGTATPEGLVQWLVTNPNIDASAAIVDDRWRHSGNDPHGQDLPRERQR